MSDFESHPVCPSVPTAKLRMMCHTTASGILRFDPNGREQFLNQRRLPVINRTPSHENLPWVLTDSRRQWTKRLWRTLRERKSGNFTSEVGRQYIGEIGKTDNGIVVVTTDLYDGRKSLPLDLQLYQHKSSLPEGKKTQHS